MENTEKLNIFYASAIEVANEQSREEMREYTISMKKLQEEFKQNKKEEIESRFQIEKGKLMREENRKVSNARTDLRRKLSLHQQEKKERLFAQVEKRLEEFRETEDYNKWMVSKIRMAKGFARREKLVVYISPSDVGRQAFLEKETGCKLTVDEKEFGGGIRAEVPSKNVLIDESFQTKLTQEWDDYTF